MDVSKQSLIDEPNAAFLNYIHESEMNNEAVVIPKDINPKMLVLISELGHVIFQY